MNSKIKNRTELLLETAVRALHAGDSVEAERLYQKVLVKNPNDIATLSNLGLALIDQKKFEKAVSIYQQAISLKPDVAQLHHNIGLAFHSLGRLGDAVESYRRALALSPEYKEPLQNLGAALKDLGRIEEAASCYGRLLELQPDDTNAKYMVESLTGVNRQEAAPEQYVRDIFDTYADHFEDELVQKLQYQIPEKLKQAFVPFIEKKQAKFTNMLDLGCGSGLVAEAFCPFTDRLIGVDLSVKMVEKAKEKSIYDAVYEADLKTFIENSTDRFDMVVAADVFIYVGKLDKIFSCLAEKMIPGGYFLFSTEGGQNVTDFSLLPTGRYAHNPMYIQDIAQQNHFLVRLCQPTGIRKEKGTWLRGELYILQFMGH